MRAMYECEQCFTEHPTLDGFVVCKGDACREEVCRDCSSPCKNPKCSHHVCDNCLKYSSSAKYCGSYCIECAIWHDDPDDPDEWKNFDYVAKGMSHKRALRHVRTKKFQAWLNKEIKKRSGDDAG